MRGQRNPFVAQEGLPFIALAAAMIAFLLRYAHPLLALIPAAALVLLFMLFRDPRRDVTSVALGIVSPVDGEVVEVDTTDRCVVQGEAYRVRIRIDAMGTYTARSPIEGRIMDLHSRVEELARIVPQMPYGSKRMKAIALCCSFRNIAWGYRQNRSSGWVNGLARVTAAPTSDWLDTPNSTFLSTARST